MYTRVIDATGWTWEYVGQCMTLPRLKAMCKRWAEVPPASEALAIMREYMKAFFGIKEGDGATSAPSASDMPPMPMSNADLVRDMHADPRSLKWMGVPNGG